ncbi:metallophosphoesterase [Ancylobacter polymorphus]|uniref:Metallophosphoesterase n=1 Tax=Ancylobacter polymorphus TaxID=223390 RepID=A0A9E7CYI0_9HYPH|nr:metallophosphoesterase [Ancylobacter polymorphus]UOK73524.1 metallophosphoesterase [Ancylobacter polymorphus]
MHFDVLRPAHDIVVGLDVDLVIVAGDVCEGSEDGFRWLRHLIPSTPILTVAGNHTFYHRVIEHELEAAREAAPRYDVLFLENETIRFGGLTFAGATLWSDFAVNTEPVDAMENARQYVNDFRLIRTRDSDQPFAPEQALQRHQESVAFLATSGADVVVTHHAPSELSVPDYGPKKWIYHGAYASNLTSLIGQLQPQLWVHGHLHANADYRIGNTRILANPMGYGPQNPGFNPTLIVEL